MVLETLVSGALGGVLRLLPEVLRFLDRRNERQHELALGDQQARLLEIQGNTRLDEKSAEFAIAQQSVIQAAMQEQSVTAQAGGRWVAALSALVRPLVTYWLIGLYVAAKVAAMVIAYNEGTPALTVLANSYGTEDLAILNMILSFWFVGRVWERRS